ncbi:FG-GAP-like repeat-containing protein [Streptomyces sp. ODS28]|uniref:FG-GAP-like repeat-containing protein n=1 Tax=Streptomyces sp. ODS28 TaxID=3136688 RepID=UPI0031EF92D2
MPTSEHRPFKPRWPRPLRVLLTAFLAMATVAASLSAVVLTPRPARADIRDRSVVAWNMQGESADGVSGIKWRHVHEHYAREASVVLLQEVGPNPPSSLTDPDNGSRVASTRLHTRDGHAYRNALWNPDGRERGIPYVVNFLQTDSNGGTDEGGRVNIAVLTREEPDEVRVVENPAQRGRRALGVRFGQDWYFSFHGLSRSRGSDSPAMVRAIDRTVRAWGRRDGRGYRWAVGGDFNRRPEDLRLPRGARTYRTHQQTHTSGRELDYFVTNENLGRRPQVFRRDRTFSDHWALQLGRIQPPAQTEPVDTKNQSMGDSLAFGKNSSDGNGYRGRYRERLRHKAIFTDTGLTWMKRDVNMVGSQRSGEMADRDHEGHPGNRIDQIASKARCSVRAYRPNVVTLMAGTNDMNQDYGLDSAPERLGSLIDQILRDAPEATVLVGTLPPSHKPGMQAKIDRYNAELPRIVRERRDQGKRVKLVGMGAVRPEDVDGSHPNDEGYGKMATAYHDALLLVENQGWLKKPVPGDGKGCDPDDPGGDESRAGPGWRALGVVAPGMENTGGLTDLADFDGDGRDDYVRVYRGGTVRIAVNREARPGKPHWKEVRSGIDLSSYEDWTTRFADLDGNGRDDIVLLPPTDVEANALVQLNQGVSGGRFRWQYVYMDGHFTDSPPKTLRFADVDGNGRDDVLRIGENGSAHAYYNYEGEADGWRWKEHRNWAPGVPSGSRGKLRLADVDGDGKADYLMVGRRGAVHAYLNRGGRGHGGFTEHRNFVRETGYPGSKSAFRDISGDGRADYTVIYDGGTVRAWLNRGGNR